MADDDDETPSSKTPKGDSFTAFMSHAVTNTECLYRLIALMVVSLALILFLIYGIFYFLKVNPAARVRVNKEGATLFFAQKEQRWSWATFLLSSWNGWTDTGIEVGPHSAVLISAHGNIYMAIDHFVDDAQQDRLPEYAGIGPEGKPWKSQRPRDLLRSHYLIVSNANHGALLAYLSTDATAPKPSPVNPRPGHIFIVGRHNVVTNESDKIATLWLTVNDMILDGSSEAAVEMSRRAYVGGTNETDGYFPKEPFVVSTNGLYQVMWTNSGIRNGYEYRVQNWSNIIHDAAWDIYFYDNLGDFLVNVRPNLKNGDEEDSEVDLIAK